MKIQKVPLINKFVERLDFDVKNYGAHIAARTAIKKSGTKIIKQGMDDQKNDLMRTKPSIILANHPHAIEPLVLLAALPDRNDTYFIGNSEYAGISENLDRFFIPVYVQNRINAEKQVDLLRRTLRLLHPLPVMSPSEERSKNIENIEKAGQVVSNGGQVIIFPGRSKLSKPWYTGLGHLCKSIANNDAFIISCFIQGTSSLDYLRVIPGMGKILPSIRVTFFQPQKVSNYLTLSPKEIALKLQVQYKEMVSSLTNQNEEAAH